MEEPLALDEYNRLWLLLARTRSALFKARQGRFGQNIRPSQAAALIVIWAYNGRATPALLSRYLFLEHHSVSELITRMIGKGLVTKNKDEKRKNVVRVTITEKGREVCHNAMQSDYVRQLISALSQEKRAQLQSCLQILLGNALKELDVDDNITFPIENS